MSMSEREHFDGTVCRSLDTYILYVEDGLICPPAPESDSSQRRSSIESTRPEGSRSSAPLMSAHLPQLHPLQQTTHNCLFPSRNQSPVCKIRCCYGTSMGQENLECGSIVYNLHVDIGRVVDQCKATCSGKHMNTGLSRNTSSPLKIT